MLAGIDAPIYSDLLLHDLGSDHADGLTDQGAHSTEWKTAPLIGVRFMLSYLHDGGQYEWDSAAPVAVALATGLHASRLDGSKLEYNKEDPWQPDILICPGKLADRLIAAVGIVRQSGSEQDPPRPAPPVTPDQPESTRWP